MRVALLPSAFADKRAYAGELKRERAAVTVSAPVYLVWTVTISSRGRGCNSLRLDFNNVCKYICSVLYRFIRRSRLALQMFKITAKYILKSQNNTVFFLNSCFIIFEMFFLNPTASAAISWLMLVMLS